MSTRSIVRTVVPLLLVAAALAYLYDRPGTPPNDPAATAVGDRAAEPRQAAREDQAIVEAFADRRSGLMVQSIGTVEKILPDDLQGSRHQRFIVRLQIDHTLLVSHNIDIAPRIPLAERDSVEFRGQYEWNARGGVVHWTHHDPDGRHPGGWVRHRGTIYE